MNITGEVVNVDDIISHVLHFGGQIFVDMFNKYRLSLFYDSRYLPCCTVTCLSCLIVICLMHS